MNIASNLSGHWTDEQLIQHLYGIGPQASHIDECDDCRQRLAAFVAARRAIELESSPIDQVPFDFLAAQRRSIYSRVAQIPKWRLGWHVRRWTAAGAMLVLLGGGALLYEQNHQRQAALDKITDAQLAQEVSRMAADSEPSPTAPLQELFDE